MKITDIGATTIKEDSQEHKELALTSRIQALKEQMDAAVVETEDQYKDACEWLKELKKATKDFTTLCEPERKAKHEAYKAVTDKIKRVKDILSLGEKAVKGKINAYLDEQERKQKEAEQKAIEEAKAAEPEAAPGENVPDLFAEPAAPIKPAAPKVQGVSFAEKWEWELEDFSKVPLEYLMLDEKKIGGVVRSMKGDTNIPGIKVKKGRTVRA